MACRHRSPRCERPASTTDSDSPDRHRGRKKQRSAGDNFFRLTDIRDDVRFGLTGAGADASERQRGTHELQELASARRIGELRGLGGKLPLHVFPEGGRIGQLFEAAPVGAALEASMAGMSPNDADRIASLCRSFNLLASMGSDFHDPAVPWNPLGRWLKLAAGLEPVTHRLQGTAASR